MNGGRGMNKLSMRRLSLLAACGLFLVFCGGVTESRGQAAKPVTLSYAIGINTSQGFSEMVAAGKTLPHTYSESFSNYLDNQKTVQIELSQKTPEGVEKIVVVDVEIPPQKKATVHVLITLKIDKSKNLTIKSSVMETGLVKTFGPFPVQ
jgi:molecular chaperone DnaK (HSP70)